MKTYRSVQKKLLLGKKVVVFLYFFFINSVTCLLLVSMFSFTFCSSHSHSSSSSLGQVHVSANLFCVLVLCMSSLYSILRANARTIYGSKISF